MKYQRPLLFISTFLVLVFTTASPQTIEGGDPIAQAPTTDSAVAEQPEPTPVVATPTPTPSPVTPLPKWYDKIKAQGQFRFRAEARDDVNRDNLEVDAIQNKLAGFLLYRIRLLVDFQPTDEFSVVVQPQFSSSFGQVDGILNGSGSATGGNITSGGTIDKAITMHQAYLQWKWNESFSLRAGRQELVYGDSMLIGNLDFNNVARSFDAFRFRYEREKHKLDFFYSRIAEDDVNRPSVNGDIDFAGLYWATEGDGFLQNFDAYALWLKDDRIVRVDAFETLLNFHFVTLGSRLKMAKFGFDFRGEGGIQVGEKEQQTMLAYMYDAEFGYTVPFKHPFRLAVGYNYASGDDPDTETFTRWHQLFPSPHPYLGYLDFFGRQNIKSAVVRTAVNISDKWTAGVDAHVFWRANTKDFVYSINTEVVADGQFFILTSEDKNLAQEIDANLKYTATKNIDVWAQGGVLFPKGFIQEEIGDYRSYYAFVQTTFRF